MGRVLHLFFFFEPQRAYPGSALPEMKASLARQAWNGCWPGTGDEMMCAHFCPTAPELESTVQGN